LAHNNIPKQLHSILSNKNSLLEKYTPENISSLVKRKAGKENTDLDAISGATPYESKQAQASLSELAATPPLD